VTSHILKKISARLLRYSGFCSTVNSISIYYASSKFSSVNVKQKSRLSESKEISYEATKKNPIEFRIIFALKKRKIQRIHCWLLDL